jgi:hypothetical protein
MEFFGASLRMHTLWLSRAYERFAALELACDKLLCGYDIVTAAVGAEWLNEQERYASVSSHTVSDIQPLYRALTSSADTDLVEICELAEYLRTFQKDPALPKILAGLKSHSYHATFLELALAYRWQRAGAKVRLQPPTPKGEADYEASLCERPYIVEASMFPADVFTDMRFRLPTIASRAADSAVPKGMGVSVKVRIHHYPPGDIEGQFREAITQACTKWRDQVLTGNPGNVSQEHDFASLEVETITADSESNPYTQDDDRQVVDAREHDWDVFQRSLSKRAPVNAPMYRVLDDEEEREKSRVFMKFPAGSVDPYEKIGKKLQKESHQLHGIRDPRVIILDISGLTGNVFELHEEQLRNVFLKLLRKTPELACVWLLMRKWTTAFRFKYLGIYIPNPESVYQLPGSFLKKLLIQEWHWDYLAGREFSRGSEEEARRSYAERAPSYKPQSQEGEK